VKKNTRKKKKKEEPEKSNHQGESPKGNPSRPFGLRKIKKKDESDIIGETNKTRKDPIRGSYRPDGEGEGKWLLYLKKLALSKNGNPAHLGRAGESLKHGHAKKRKTKMGFTPRLVGGKHNKVTRVTVLMKGSEYLCYCVS